jgi:hypothetical protein
MRRASGPFRGGIVSLFALAMLLQAGHAEDSTVNVRYREGVARGFLVVRSETGAVLASGEFSQIPRGDAVKLRLVFHFRDGSLDDDTAVYAQKSTFHLITDRHIQKGPSFPEPLDITIDTRSQQVGIRDLSKGGEAEKTEHVDLPPNLANGLLFNLIKNLPKDSPRIEVPFLALSTKPRMVSLRLRWRKRSSLRSPAVPPKR